MGFSFELCDQKYINKRKLPFLEEKAFYNSSSRYLTVFAAKSFNNLPLPLLVEVLEGFYDLLNRERKAGQVLFIQYAYEGTFHKLLLKTKLVSSKIKNSIDNSIDGRFGMILFRKIAFSDHHPDVFIWDGVDNEVANYIERYSNGRSVNPFWVFNTFTERVYNEYFYLEQLM